MYYALPLIRCPFVLSGMSIKDYNAEVATVEISELESASRAPQRKGAHKRPGWLKLGDLKRSPYLPLWFCLLIALAIRVLLVIHTQGFIDGDEAVVGIQAEHILHGELPAYFYNQPYMGSLEAYLLALIFAIVGPSVWALRAEPTILSLVIVWITWKFAAELADAAHLPPHARHWFMTISTLLAAIPPLYDTVLELRTLGGYVEVFLLMLLLLLSVLKLTRRRAAGASSRELAWRWAGIGFLIGLGFWVNPLIIYGILAAALWIGWDCIRARKQVGGKKNVVARIMSFLLPAMAALPACIGGLIPAIIWGAANQWQNFTYLLQLGGNTPLRPEVQAQYPTRLSIVFGLTRLYTTCVSPRVISGALPEESPLLAFLHSPTLLLGVFCILATTSLVVLSFVRPHPALLRIRRLAGLPVLFAACTALIFCATKTAAIGLWSCNYDLAGRYATPLMLVLPFFFATVVTAVVMMEVDRHTKVQEQSPREDNTHNHRLSSVVMPGPRAQRAMLGALVGILLLAVYMQVFSYGLTEAASTFQSPYCTFPPGNDDAVIAYMQREHIHYAWANSWLGYTIVFKTNGGIDAADPLPFVVNNLILDRIPANSEAVRNSDRPSFVVFVEHKDRYPLLLQLLDKEGVTYRVARFPAQDGRDVLVMTPLNRTVSPFDPGPFFSIFICSRDS